MENMNIGFIGSGNMARSIIGGLTSGSTQYNIYAADPAVEKLASLKEEFGVIACTGNEELLQQSDVVVLSVKPQVMPGMLCALSDAYNQSNPLIISIAAGVRCNQILNWLNSQSAPCIRVMPNTPALIKTGASGLFALNATDEQKQLAENIMNAVGITVWLNDENLIDTVTAVSGSGPAYFFYLMEAIYNSAVKNGLDESVAKKLTLQTALGAAKLACASDVEFKALREQVTSPGGTTQAAINTLKDNNFNELVDNAVTQAAIRSKELSHNQ